MSISHICRTMAVKVHIKDLHTQRLNSVGQCGDRSKRKHEKKKGCLCVSYADEIETNHEGTNN